MIKAKPVVFIVANNFPPVNDEVGHYSFNRLLPVAVLNLLRKVK